jgi:crotonobetainyl-CoA:carnitine CoA-transferase CaiB-like acyl-CoA transferase
MWITITIDSDDAWARFAEFTGDKDLMNAGFATLAARWSEHNLIDDMIAAWTRTRDRDELSDQLQDLGILAAPVLSSTELLSHPQFEQRGYWQWLDREYVGLTPHPITPYRTGPEAFKIDTPAPTLGEHSREILGGLLDMSDGQLDHLEAERIIGEEPDRTF